jgi:hypothetical protein
MFGLRDVTREAECASSRLVEVGEPFFAAANAANDIAVSFLVRSFATPFADYSACPWVNTARRLTGVTVGGTVSVLVPAATAILGTAIIGRSVVAPFFQATTAVGPIAAATRQLAISWTTPFASFVSPG